MRARLSQAQQEGGTPHPNTQVPAAAGASQQTPPHDLQHHGIHDDMHMGQRLILSQAPLHLGRGRRDVEIDSRTAAAPAEQDLVTAAAETIR